MSRNKDNPQKVPLFYHPSCNACKKLFALIKDDKELFELIDISDSKRIPNNLEKIPCILVNEKLIDGKKCFEMVTEILNGPKCIDIYSCKTNIESYDSGSGFNMKTNYSTLDNGIDGFKNVPVYVENNQTLEQALMNRSSQLNDIKV